MRDTDLPNPNVGDRGYHLRRTAAKAISQMETVANNYYGGKHPDAASVVAFFDACSAACDPLIPAAGQNAG